MESELENMEIRFKLYLKVKNQALILVFRY